MSWCRPFRRYGGRDYRALSTAEHRSCRDCEHLRVAGQPARRCELYQDKHIYSPQSIDREVMEEGDMGRAGSVADRCNDFQVASEFDEYLIVFDEVSV